MKRAAAACALIAGSVALAGCGTDPLLGDQARLGSSTVTLASGAVCTSPGSGCAAPLLPASASDVLELGVSSSVELSASVVSASTAPGALPAPVAVAGYWTIPLAGLTEGTYLVTLLPPGEVRQVQLRVS